MRIPYQFMTILLLSVFLATTIGFGQSTKPAKDYLGVPGPIQFAHDIYPLAWSSHPAPTFYKQEYLKVGDKPERFKNMLLLDVITGAVPLRDVVRANVDELQRLKQANAMVNYEVLQKNGEYLLDFLLSQSTPDGKGISIIERNVYRYKTVTTQSGQSGVLLFGVSRRAYDSRVTPFLTQLKANRSTLLRQVSEMTLPQITIVQ